MESDQFETSAVSEEKKNIFFEVTPVSKYFAMALFIVIPFIGGLIGYTLGMQNQDFQPNIMSTPTFSAEEIAELREIQEQRELQNKLSELAKIVASQQSQVSTTTLYLAEKENIDWYFDNPEDLSPYTAIDNVIIGEGVNRQFLHQPFTPIASTTEALFLTKHCFKATECTFNGLYRLYLPTNTLSKMSISDKYNEVEYGSIQSPISTKFLTTSYKNRVSELYVLDLVTDTATLLKSYPPESDTAFCGAGMGCYMEVKWVDNKNFDITTYINQFSLEGSTSSESFSI